MKLSENLSSASHIASWTCHFWADQLCPEGMLRVGLAHAQCDVWHLFAAWWRCWSHRQQLRFFLHVLRGSPWCCGKTLCWWWVPFWAKKMMSDIRLHWGDESYWSLVYLRVQQYSLCYCAYRRNCCHWLESMLSRKLPLWVIQQGFGTPNLRLWSLRIAIMGKPTWEVSLY